MSSWLIAVSTVATLAAAVYLVLVIVRPEDF